MDLKEETRNGYLVTANMKKVWSIQLDLLRKLLEVCQENNLNIWAEGGTLLGAVRHKGYIPWDDDIDMAMFRDDYDKLVDIASKEFKYPYFFQTVYNEKKFNRGHAQLRNSKTSAILPYEIDCDFNQGIFIDIFVYDAVNDNNKRLLLQQKNSQIGKKIIDYYCRPSFLFKNPFKIFFKVFIELFFIIYPYRKFFRNWENRFRSNRISNYQNISLLSFLFTDWGIEKYTKNKNLYAETVYLPFEDGIIPAPKGYDEILTIQYGDYMKPVKAPSMHGEVIFDTEIPYTKKLKYLRDRQPSLLKKIYGRFFKK